MTPSAVNQLACEQKALLADVTAAPDDDAPRLIYADWCEDHGEEARAEFIRLQVALALRDPAYRLDEGMNWKVHDASAVPEVRRAADCLRAVCLADVRRGELYHLHGRVWRRGFVEEGITYLPHWKHQGPSVVRATPLRRLHLLFPAESRDGWFYYEESTRNPRWYGDALSLPPELFDRLGGFVREGRRSADYPSRQRFYATRQDAEDALSRACLDWARAQKEGRP